VLVAVLDAVGLGLELEPQPAISSIPQANSSTAARRGRRSVASTAAEEL